MKEIHFHPTENPFDSKQIRYYEYQSSSMKYTLEQWMNLIDTKTWSYFITIRTSRLLSESKCKKIMSKLPIAITKRQDSLVPTIFYVLDPRQKFDFMVRTIVSTKLSKEALSNLLEEVIIAACYENADWDLGLVELFIDPVDMLKPSRHFTDLLLQRIKTYYRYL